MNCFQLIKTVLDEAYAAIPGDDDAKDAAIKKAHRELSAAYANLTEAGCLDYTQPCRRFAYIYKYTTCHANTVYCAIGRFRILRKLFECEKVTISCIGGGPGSDFLGVLKYCMGLESPPELKCRLFDRDPAWAESWDDVDDKLGPLFRISTSFQPFDVTNDSTWKGYAKYFNSDLFMLVYFLSEVYANRKQAAPYFKAMMEGAKEGSSILYIDNNADEFNSWFEKLIAGTGFNIVGSADENFILPWEEEKKDLSPYYEKFESPKLQAYISYRVAIKT